METKKETQVIEEQEVQETKVEVIEDQEPVKEQKPNRNEILRELSKDLGINLFDTEGLQELKKYQESKLSELEKTQKELEEYRQREVQYKEELENKRLDSLRVQYNIDEDRFDDFLVLAKNYGNEETSTEEAFQKTLERYGDTFISKKERENLRLGIQVDDNSEATKTIQSFDQEVLEAWKRRKNIK